jgi:putative ABC transport system substrate-binding protein
MPVAVTPFISLLRKRLRHWRVRLALILCMAPLAAAAGAAGLTVLMGDEVPAHAEFVQHLRAAQAPSGRFELVRLSPGAADVAQSGVETAEAAAGAERAVNAGVRTRSLRTATPAPAEASLTMAVGEPAARVALDRPGQQPLLLAMLSRLEYENLRASAPALRRGDRRVGVLLRDPAMADQLALVAAVLPNKPRLGVVATPESEPLVRELQRAAAQGGQPAWDLQVEYAPDARSLAAALRAVVPRSDALMVLPDLIGDNQAATLAVLRAGASAGLPVFGASEGLVRSGGLAAAVSTPAQLAQQAQLLGQKLASHGSSNNTAAPLVESAAPPAVRVNATVARGLGLRLPQERELSERLTATR